MKTLPRHGDGVGLQIFYIFSPPCIQPGGAGAGAVDDVLITRGAVTSELRSSHVSDDNLRRPRGHYLWPCLCRKALFVTTFLHFNSSICIEDLRSFLSQFKEVLSSPFQASSNMAYMSELVRLCYPRE